MSKDVLGAVVVGAGQAGLAASYHLKRLGVEHVRLERGWPGESWRTQRWDSFVLNTTNDMNALPGSAFDLDTPGAFEPTASLVDYFDEYVRSNNLPLRASTSAINASRMPGSDLIEVETSAGKLVSRNLVVASGAQNVPLFPAAAKSCPAGLTSMHAADYRNPGALPDGAVLVIGSGQSGCQIAEELLAAGRTVYMSTSKVGRVRRKIRGKDVLYWLRQIGFMSQTVANLPDPAMQFAKQPITTGVDGGHTVSLQSLWRAGTTLLGRLESFEGTRAVFRDNLQENIRFGDSFSQNILAQIGAAIDKMEPNAPPLELDPADDVDPGALELSAPTELDLREAGIGSIIWTTGFGANYDWLSVDGATDDNGRPIHTDGVSAASGVYFLGNPWLRARASALIYGADADGAAIAEHIAAGL